MYQIDPFSFGDQAYQATSAYLFYLPHPNKLPDLNEMSQQRRHGKKKETQAAKVVTTTSISPE
jgi:hypothetical protein